MDSKSYDITPRVALFRFQLKPVILSSTVFAPTNPCGQTYTSFASTPISAQPPKRLVEAASTFFECPTLFALSPE